MRKVFGLAACAAVFTGAGCVSLTDYNRLQERYDQQQQYVQRHKDEVKELEKREQLLAIQVREKEKEAEAARARLAGVERDKGEKPKGKEPLTVIETQAAAKPSETVFSGFKVNEETHGLILEHDLMFASGKSVLKDSGKKLLGELAGKLNAPEYAHMFIRIDGHTDDQPVKFTKKENHDNWELGAKRAKAVLDYLIERGVSPERCFYASFNKYRPLKDGDRAKQRRVEVVLFDKKM